MTPKRARLLAIPVLAVSAVWLAGAAKGPQPDAVRVRVSVAPEVVPAGGDFQAIFELVPGPGIKLNRYPKVKVEIPPQEGLAGGAATALGNDAPPPPDDLQSNYFKNIDPIRLGLKVHPSAARGRHELGARVSYVYCVASSGYCAPVKTEVKVPLTVR